MSDEKPKVKLEPKSKRLERARFHVGVGVAAIVGWGVGVWLWTWKIDTDIHGPDYFAPLFWQLAAFGVSSMFVWGVRLLGEWWQLPDDHLPHAHDPVNKPPKVAIFHGMIERPLFTLLAIPLLRPSPDHFPFPDPTSTAGLLVAIALYLTLRERSKDVAGKLGVYSAWNMVVSVGLGVMGGWVFWHPQVWVTGWPF